MEILKIVEIKWNTEDKAKDYSNNFTTFYIFVDKHGIHRGMKT